MAERSLRPPNNVAITQGGDLPSRVMAGWMTEVSSLTQGSITSVNGDAGPAVTLDADDIPDDETLHKFVSQAQLDLIGQISDILDQIGAGDDDTGSTPTISDIWVDVAGDTMTGTLTIGTTTTERTILGGLPFLSGLGRARFDQRNPIGGAVAIHSQAASLFVQPTDTQDAIRIVDSGNNIRARMAEADLASDTALSTDDSLVTRARLREYTQRVLDAGLPAEDTYILLGDGGLPGDAPISPMLVMDGGAPGD